MLPLMPLWLLTCLAAGLVSFELYRDVPNLSWFNSARGYYEPNLAGFIIGCVTIIVPIVIAELLLILRLSGRFKSAGRRPRLMQEVLWLTSRSAAVFFAVFWALPFLWSGISWIGDVL